MKPLGTRQQGQEQRQAEVRSAALELFRTRGFDATSVRDIAAAAGVSVGTVAHLGDKATLFLDVMQDNAFAQVGGAWKDSAMSLSGPLRLWRTRSGGSSSLP